jgi:hypothetical protein
VTGDAAPKQAACCGRGRWRRACVRHGV